ncbi:MAG: iron ABC transporter permease [Planctomycetes bacterium]|nr:iron ABC transporter permease [Planctomycetota bacterium]
MTDAPTGIAPHHRPEGVLTRGKLLAGAVILLLCGVMIAFLIVPLALTISSGLVHEGRLSVYWMHRVLANEVLMGQLRNSFALACVSTLVTALIAIPLATLSARCSFAGGRVLGALVLAPLILPPFVGAISMKRLFSQFGALNLLLDKIGILDFSTSLPPDWLGGGLSGVVLLQSLHLFPILYLNTTAALANVDPSYAQAARNLGAGPVRTFLTVTLPLIRPGLFAGGTIVFIWSFTDIGTPLILGYEELAPVTIFKELARGDTGGRTFSLVFVLLSSSVTLYVLGKFIFGRPVKAVSAKASVAFESRRMGAIGTVVAWLAFGGVLVLALAPHVGVLLMAASSTWVTGVSVLPTAYTWRHIAFVVTDPATYTSIINSLKYAGVSTCLDVVLGSAIAWMVVRTRAKGRSVLDGLSMLPLAVPGLILAAGSVAMTASGPLKAIGPLGNPFIILVIAYAIRRVPFMVRSVSAGLQQVPESLEEAARNLGSSRVAAVFRITLPLIAANIIAGAVLTFAFSMLEVSDSLILAQIPQYYPITKQIYTLAVSTGSPETAHQAAALGVYGMGLLGGTLALAAALMGKRLGAIFRA